MKILIATGVYPPESGGPATYTQLLETELPARGITVRVLPFRSVRHLPKLLRHISYFFKCVRMAMGVDSIYALDPVSVGLPASLAAFLLRKKFIIRIPGDYAWEQGCGRFGVTDTLDEFQQKTYGWRIELLRSIQRFVVRRAVKIIVPSDYMRRLVSGWGVNSHLVETVYSSIRMPVEFSLPSDRPDGFLLVTVARLVPWKGIEGIIRVVSKRSQWRLVVVDDGPERSKLESLASELDVSDRIRFVGRLPHAEAMGWIKAADAFVLNSTYEGLSHLLIEAMSLGTPVVATNVGGNPELVANGSEGMVIAPQDDAALQAAVTSIEEHPDEARSRALRAAERSQQFSITVTIEKLCSILTSL